MNLFNFNINNLNYDVFLPSKGQLGFQDPATPIMAGITDLHHTILFYIIIIFFLVTWLLIATIYNYGLHNKKKKNSYF